MDRDEADERHTRLVENVARARELLQQVGEERWADWVATVYTELGSPGGSGLTRLLAAFGGMGSLNDLVIHPVNGHTLLESEVGPVNRTLDELRSILYADATALHEFSRAEERPPRGSTPLTGP